MIWMSFLMRILKNWNNDLRKISPKIWNCFSKFWKLWNLTFKVSIEFFNLLYYLNPELIFDQKIEFLSEFRWQSAYLKWFLVIVVFILFDLKIVKFDTRSFARVFQFYLFFVPRIHFWQENRIPEWIPVAITLFKVVLHYFCIYFLRIFDNR